MNWYKKSQFVWQEEVIKFLNSLGIKNEMSGNFIKIERDSIINVLNKDENESYRKLILILNQKFNSRFNYALKDDNWFWLEKII